MQIPVESTAGRAASRRRRWAVLAGLVLVAALALAGGHEWVRRALARQVEAMGGAPAGDVLADFGTLQGQAWPRQRAAAAHARAIPTILVDVKFRNVRKLAAKREEALRLDYLIQEEGDYVPATLRVVDGDRRTAAKAKLRLKGDFTDHLRGDKWSFRVKTKGDDQVLGMRVFSVQHPKTRGYAHEPVFLDYARRHGVLAPRYRFIRLVVNGNDKGVMALEEHFSKELLESQHRREGVIVRFDEDLKWRTLAMMGQSTNFAAPYPFARPFEAGDVAADPSKRAQADAAVALLRAFVTKALPPSKVFDPAATARFLAVCEVFGAEHALAWNNMRFYFNPITGLLEPILFDANLQDYAFRFIPSALVSVYELSDTMSSDWLRDPAIRAPFLRDLARLSAEFVQADTQAWLKGREDELCRTLHTEFPLVPDIPFGFYALRAQRLARVDEGNYRALPLMPPNYPVLMHAFVHTAADGIRLEVYNLVPYPIEVTAITAAPHAVSCDAALPLTRPPTVGLEVPQAATVLLRTAAGDEPGKVIAQLRLAAWIPGYPETRTTMSATPYPPTAQVPHLPDGDWAEVARRHPFVRREGETARIGPGAFDVRGPLVLPAGADLEVAAGTTLRFSTDGLLLVRGAVQMPGTKDDRIRLVAAAESWRGVAVFGDPQRESRWTHVEVEGTTGLALGAWRPTGSVMFYASKVRLEHCAIRRNRSEDALNLVRCGFVFDGLAVETTTSDAVDLDFCKGSMQGGLIRDARGDGLDVSGTDVDVRGTHFEEVADKALSVGERSNLRAEGVTIRGCGTGLASKDDSNAVIRASTMTGIEHVAVMAYTKKPEYGGARVLAKGLEVEGARHRFLAQIGSAVRVDERDIEPVELDVEELYRTGYMRKDR